MYENILEIKEKARAGRNEAILFDNKQNERLVDSVCARLVSRYYDESPENTKKNFVLSGQLRMGKTLFWAYIYIICRKRMLINIDMHNHNLEPFVEHLQKRLGTDHVGDRSLIQRQYKKLVDNHADNNVPFDLFQIRECDKAFYQKFRDALKFIEKCWDEVKL